MKQLILILFVFVIASCAKTTDVVGKCQNCKSIEIVSVKVDIFEDPVVDTIVTDFGELCGSQLDGIKVLEGTVEDSGDGWHRIVVTEVSCN